MTNQFSSSEDVKLFDLKQNTGRRTFLRRSATGLALVAPVGLLAACGETTPTTPTGGTTPTTAPVVLALKSVTDSKAQFTEIRDHEVEHVKFLQDALTKAGATPRPKPTFKGLEQADVNAFAAVANVFENVGVGAYLLGAANIKTPAYLLAAASILTVEARHAGFVGALIGKPLSPSGARDVALTFDAIVKDVTPFLDKLNGPAPAVGSDADILNFALLLEYLEAEFYTVNVAKFFA